MRPYRNTFIRTLTYLFALMLLVVAPANAQVTTGDITGRVTDEQQKVVAGATVTATNKGTGLARTSTTNDGGDFSIAELAPGRYEVTVEAPSFSKSVVRDYEVNVGSTRTLNIVMKPGELTAVVEVTADTVALETTKSEIAGVVTPVEVQNLPLLNRTFAALSVIMPEARPVGNFDPTKTRVGNVAFNGGDGRQVDVNVDGGDNKDNVVGSLLQNFSYESIQEFQVLQHRWTAESGRAVGGVVNVITKSGSNDFHGSFFANFRDEQWRAFDFFEKQRGLTEKPSFSRQEIGGSISGPIKRDRLFFFGALERFRERQINALSATAATQLPLIPGVGTVGDVPTPYDDWLATVKVDHRLNDDQTMFYRYAYQKNNSPNDQITVPATADITGGNTNDNKLHSFIVNHTWTVSPTKLNQWSFHYQDFSNFILGVTDRANIVFPSVQTGRNQNVPQSTLEKKYQLRDDFSATVGNHSLKTGINYIHTKLDGFFFFGAQGHQITFFDDPSVIVNNAVSPNCPDLNGNGLRDDRCYPQGFATPGAVRQITFSDGRGDHKQQVDQLAFYIQDDYKIRPNLTLNLGLRWDANIGNLPRQDNNRTIRILQQLNHPLAQAITGDPEKLRRTTPSWTEFQPRVGFAWDPTGEARTVIRGGYGIFFDQLFQNLTLFSLTQSNPELFQTALTLVNNFVGVGQLSAFRFGVDPLPQPPAGFSFSALAVGGFGRINDPDASEPYVQKFSIGFEHQLGKDTTISSDYVHTLGLHESRVQVINPRIRQICDAGFPGSNPASPLCVRGVNTRLLDRAFVDAGLGAGRIEQINMIGTTNRSLFDSWITTLRRRTKNTTLSASYVLANSRSWGGQPVASYSGNAIQITPDNQFKPEEFGPTRIDERHRVVVSGVFDIPWGVQLAPIMQIASSRPYSPAAGLDIDGDGLAVIDRLCEGTDLRATLEAVVRNQPIPANARALGCRQLSINSQRGGFVVSQGNIEERSGRYFNVDLRVSKAFGLGERFKVRGYADFYNLFNTENLGFGPPALNGGSRHGLSPVTSASTFLQPGTLYGPGFGPPVGRPLTVQFGARLDF